MIELMTLFMSNLDIDEEICKHQVRAFCDNKPEGVTLDVCAKCIKQYFERKVMSNLDIDEEICKHQVRAFCDNKPEGVTLDVCAKCIKQYFERKVENGG